MSYLLAALAVLPILGVIAFLAVRARRRKRALALLIDDRDFELRFPETTEERERPVTGRQTVIGRRTARR